MPSQRSLRTAHKTTNTKYLMKLMSAKSSNTSAAILAGMLLIPAASQAAQLAYEGFNYAAGSGNLNTLNGGSGWGGTWQTVNNGSADVVASSLVAGTSAATDYDARSIGNSCNLPNQRRIGRYLDTSLGGPFGSRGFRDSLGRIGADGKTIYISFMQQPNGTSNYYEFEFHRGDLGDGGRIGGIGNDTGTNNVNLRAPNGTHTTIGAGSTAVNFYVVRIDFKAGNDDVYVYRNPTTTTEPGSATLTRLAAADMSFDGISFGAFNNGRTVAHDEVRLGETWADVTVPQVALPAFTSQPRSSTSFVGGNVVLAAEVSGQPLPTYQWYQGTTLLTGKISATLALSNVQPGDAGDYFLTATNSQGAVTSNAAHLTVQQSTPGLLAYEGFDYDAGSGKLTGKTGGLGWGAAWANVNGGGGNVISGSLTASTNAPNGYDAQSLGNSAYCPNSQRDGRVVDTSLGGRFGTAGYVDANGNIGADGKTVYISFLQQPDGTSYFYEFELHRGNLGDPGRIGGVGNDTGNPVVNLRTGGTTTLIGPGSTGVNLYVVRIDFKAGNDDVYVYQNPLSATEPATPTLKKLAISDMSFNGVSLAAYVNGRTVKHDEIRIGQSWSDVVFGSSRRQLVWTGDGSSNTWNFAAANWNAGAGATAFVDGDPVNFDDSGLDSPAVNIPASVDTASLTATNATKNYTLGGAGTINCSGSLAKSGGGTFTLTGPSNFSSAAVVNGGTLALNGSAFVGGGLTANAGTTTLGGTNSLVGLISTSGSVSLTGPTTIAGTGAFIWMGNTDPLNAAAASTVTIEAGGSLTMTAALADSWVIGRDGGKGVLTQNGGTVTYNPTNRNEAYIGASMFTTTTAAYNMHGGTLEMSAKNLIIALGPVTTSLNQSGGTINLRQLALGASLSQGAGTGNFEFTGGVMNVGTGGIVSSNGHYAVNLGGGTLSAAADWGSPLGMTLTDTNGAVTFDTAGHKITLTGAVGGSGGLVKTGAGTLVLNGFNSFSGPTTVSGGTLAGAGNSLSPTLTVAAGASVAPGNGGIGTFYCAAATFASGSTLALEINSSNAMADELVAAAEVDITGANVTFNEIGSGTLAGGTKLVILDYTGSTLTGNFAGHAEGASVTVGTNTFVLSYVDSSMVTLTAVDPFSAWAAAHGLDGSADKDPAFGADPDHDGIANGLEWILGGNPLAQDSAALITTSGSAANGLTLAFTRAEASLGSATLTVEWTTSLDGVWTEVPVEQAGGSYADNVTVTVNQAATPDAVTVHIPASNAVNGGLFARLRASMP